MLTCTACQRKTLSILTHPIFRSENTLATARPAYPSILFCRYRRFTTTATFLADVRRDKRPDDAQKKRKLSPHEWAAQKQLQYLKDPLHIANYVKKALDKDKFEEAALIVRNASRNTKITVGWNHLIDYQMKHHRLHAGLKLYNEMKKRSQLPNAHTYTIIFKGCAISPHPKLAVSEAVRIYNNLLNSDRMKPNTIHMNAVLQVCAKAKDLESMFTIAQTAFGVTRAPASSTYTIILNGLRASVNVRQHGPAENVDEAEVASEKAKAIKRAKAIWEEVISKWRSGSIVIDESLVCAMGWILLMGDYKDAVSVEKLLEQTMNIPADDEDAASQEPKTEADLNGADADTESGRSRPGVPRKTPAITYARPGNNSLSMILSSLEATGRTSRVQRYWDVFTKEYNVVPDANNWHARLTALRRGKNSYQSVVCLREMPAKLFLPKNFSMAMYTCFRDNLNPHAFEHATETVDIMLAKLKAPDPKTLRVYLRVALANKRHIIERSGSGYKDAMARWGEQLATAIDKLWKPYMMLTRECENDEPISNRRRELVALARKMIAACDRVVFGNMVPPEVEERLKPRRNSLNRVVVRHFEEMEKLDPGFRREKYDEGKNEDEDEEEFEDEDGSEGGGEGSDGVGYGHTRVNPGQNYSRPSQQRASEWAKKSSENTPNFNPGKSAAHKSQFGGFEKPKERSKDKYNKAKRNLATERPRDSFEEKMSAAF